VGKEKESGSTLTRKEVLDMLSDGKKTFENCDMRKANLIKIDFSGCNLQGANLSYSNLKEANFSRADMRGCSLWNANLESANFTDANLENADLDYAKLRGAILFNANLRMATLPTDLIPREDIFASVENGCKVGQH
jgi:uncharacterized protein YjbI with pentapeptide repeats